MEISLAERARQTWSQKSTKMAIKVQASRFAVLRVEDDDDSDEKDTKAKQPTNKAGQQAAEGKKKAKKKKKAEQLKHETEEVRVTCIIARC